MEKHKSSYDSLLAEYGECIGMYCGHGALTLQDGKKFDCQFEVGQLTNGQVLLLCDLLPPFPSNLSISPIKFEGATSEGFRLYANNGMFETRYLPNIPNDRSSGFWAAFHINEVFVHMAEAKDVSRLHFGITNFDFIGTQPSRRPDNSFYRILSLTLRDDSQTTKLLIRPLDLYERIMKRVETLKGIDVTCEAITDVVSDVDIARVTEVVDNLCYILSVARGTKIQWVYCSQYNSDGKPVKRIHSSRITKPYCPLIIIDPIAGGGGDTKTFIEQAYKVYVRKRASYKLSKGTIDAYLDAKAEADYLEMRGVKFAVAMEILKTVFRKVTKIKGGLFKSIIENLCNSINLRIDQQEIDLFVECRNSLIHAGEFYCETATPKKRNRFKPLNTKTEEYLFLVNFLDRVFLKLLGYSGPYIDWRILGNPIHRDQV